MNGSVADKPSRQVLPGDAIVLVGEPPPYVSRAGLKLAKALDTFAVDLVGARCLDVGSSTGGFTDCLLQSGAREVIAVDVGKAQLHEHLRADPRVDVREQTDIRTVTADDIGELPTIVTCDVSFISLTKVLPAMAALLDPFGVMMVLVKPQFEAGREEASRGRGVITDPTVWARVLNEVVEAAGEVELFAVDGTASPIKGGSGNVEFLLMLQTWDDDVLVDVDSMVAEAQEL